MNRHAAVSRLNALNGLKSCAGCIINGLFNGHGLSYAAAVVNTGPTGLIGKADKMGISITVKKVQIKKCRTLAVGQVDRVLILCGRNHSGCQNHHVRRDCNIFVKQRIFTCNGQGIISLFFDAHYIALGKKNTFIILGRLIKEFHVSRSTHVLIKDICLAVRIVLAYIFCMLKSNSAGHGVTVWEIVVIIRSAGTLDKYNAFYFLTIGWSCDLTGAGHFFKFKVGKDIFEFTMSKVLIFRHISRDPSGCKNNRAEHLGIRIHITVRL